MDQGNQAEVRADTQRRRRPPAHSQVVEVGFRGTGKLTEGFTSPPTDLVLEVTNANHELAEWFHDDWWTDLIQHWGDDPLTLHIAATPSALLHMVVLYELEMVQRVASRWRIVGHAFRSSLSADGSAELLASSPYHEIRFIDDSDPNLNGTDQRTSDCSLDRLFGDIRRAQARVGTTMPILVRLPADDPRPSGQSDENSSS